jgi:probable rRNA maturation factor
VREAWRITNHESQITCPELSLVFVTDAEIALLNKRFLDHTGPTDVITFEHGEIVVSTERTVAQARRFGATPASELALYLIHGLLHLAGYDDTKPASRRIMHRRQSQILRQVNRSVGLSIARLVC